MRFFGPALLSLASSCLATPAADGASHSLEKRADGTQTVLKSFDAIYARIVTFNKVLYPLNSTDFGAQLALAGPAGLIGQELDTQSAIVKKAGNIPLSCVLRVASKAQFVIDQVAKTLAELKTKKPLTDGAGTSGIVVDLVGGILTSADHFIAALKPKVPADAQFLVNGDKRQLDLLLQNTINLFKQPAANSTKTS